MDFLALLQSISIPLLSLFVAALVYRNQYKQSRNNVKPLLSFDEEMEIDPAENGGIRIVMKLWNFGVGPAVIERFSMQDQSGAPLSSDALYARMQGYGFSSRFISPDEVLPPNREYQLLSILIRAGQDTSLLQWLSGVSILVDYRDLYGKAFHKTYRIPDLPDLQALVPPADMITHTKEE